jgi:hypothetical protein
VWPSSSSIRARSFYCPTERCSPNCSSSNQACTAVRISSMLAPRKEAAPLRFFVHHSRVAADARAFNRCCSLAIRPPSAGAEGWRRFIDRSLQLVGAAPTGCHPRSCDARERGGRSWASVERTQASASPLLVGQLYVPPGYQFCKHAVGCGPCLCTSRWLAVILLLHI